MTTKKETMSMRKMFRYEVPIDDQWHEIKLTGDPVRIAATVDPYILEFWAEHDDAEAARTRSFRVFGTGQPLPTEASWVGTADRTRLGLVWHLYEDTA